jgi:WD40 repeat protein
VPRDLETIVLKAITRDPAHRYQTPTELADDLRRFVEDRPIRARRAGAGERLWRWCRRNPVVAGLVAAVQVALIGLLVLAAWSHRRISQALSDTEEARDKAVAVSYRALLNQTQALRLAHASGWRHQALQNLQKLAHLETPQRDLAELRSEAIACLGGFDANEETRFLGHTQSVWSLDFSPDGSLLATAGYDGHLLLWDMKERRLVRDVPDPAVNLAKRHNVLAPLPAVRFRPDGTSLAYATWEPGFGCLDLGGADREPTWVEFPAPARYLAFDRTGGLLAVSRGDGQVGLYDAGTRTLRREIHTRMVGNFYFPVALSPDGGLVATVEADNAVQLHTVGDPEKEAVTLGRHRDTIRSLCFSPTGRLLASGSADRTVKLWHVGGSDEPITLLGHSARVAGVAFSPDGSLLASASDDETVRLWETQTGQAVMVLHPGIGALLSVAFSPDGSRLAIGGAGHPGGGCPVSLYQLTSRKEQRRLAGHSYTVHAVAFHPTWPLLASGSADKSVIRWDLSTGRPAPRWEEKRNNPILCIAFAPAGDLLAVGVGTYSTNSGRDYTIALRETATGTIRRPLEGPSSEVRALAFDASGKLLAAGTSDGTGFVWDVASAGTTQQWKGPTSLEAVAFLRGGTHLLTGRSGGQVVIRELKGPEGETAREAEVSGGLNCLAVAPGERALAVGGNDGAIRILTLPGLETTATLEKAHEGRIKAVAFSPDGRLLASGGLTDRRVILWDARTYQRLGTLPQTGQAESLAFDPAGRHLAICGAETLVTVWDLALVNEELAAVGLDWDASLPKTGLPPGVLVDARPAPVTVVQAPTQPVSPARIAEPSKPSVVVLPLNPRRRTATVEEIAAWVRQLDDDSGVRQAAADALVEVGSPAVAALTAAAEQPQRRTQARAVLDRIAGAEVLAPTRVRLKLVDALPADAVRALSEQSHIPITCEAPADDPAAKRINLDLEDVCVWEALDRICAAADLGHHCPLGSMSVQVNGNVPRPPAVRAYAGPFRIHLTAVGYARNIFLLTPTPQRTEILHLNLGLLSERNKGLLSWPNGVRVTEPRDLAGQSLDFPAVPVTTYAHRWTEWAHASWLNVTLKAPQRRDDRIKVLKGVLPVEIMVRRQDLVTVPNLATDIGRTFRGEQGHRLTVEGMQSVGGPYLHLDLRLIGPPGWHYDGNLHGVELVYARGETLSSPHAALSYSRARQPQPEDLAWLAASPQAPSLLGVPWPALAVAPPGQERLEWRGTVRVFNPLPSAPVQLRFYRFERLKVDLPFELHDVPLP